MGNMKVFIVVSELIDHNGITFSKVRDVFTNWIDASNHMELVNKEQDGTEGELSCYIAVREVRE